MPNALKNVNFLTPENLVSEAPAMIARILDHMQTSLARDGNLPNVPYCALLVKLGAQDLAREFPESLKATLASQAAELPSLAPMFTLELTLDDAPDPAAETMRQSSALFEQLCANAKTLGIKGLDAIGKTTYMTALREAMAKARIDDANVNHLMPYACSALDVELAALYGRVSAHMKSGQ